MATPEDWHCERPDCDLGVDEHSLALVIQHTFEGDASVTGRDFDAEESAEVAERILARLAS